MVYGRDCDGDGDIDGTFWHSQARAAGLRAGALNPMQDPGCGHVASICKWAGAGWVVVVVMIMMIVVVVVAMEALVLREMRMACTLKVKNRKGNF